MCACICIFLIMFKNEYVCVLCTYVVANTTKVIALIIIVLEQCCVINLCMFITGGPLDIHKAFGRSGLEITTKFI